MKVWNITGAHIAALLLRFFVMYLPFMIQAGMVYKAIPPLFSIKDGKRKVKDPKTGKNVTRDKRKYFTEQIDIVRYIQKIFQKEYNMQYMNKAQVSPKDLTLFFMNNVDYIYYLEDNLANTYALNPYLLEMVLNHYVLNGNSINASKLKKEVKSKYRFMDVYDEGDNIVIRGTIEGSNLIIFNDKFLEDCSKILEIINANNKNLYYLVNGEVKSILEIMNIYKNMSPNGIQRYKGLGEMNYWELAESSLYPGSDRTLVRYTMEDALDEISAIREYESNSKKILSLVSNVTREDLLD